MTQEQINYKKRFSSTLVRMGFKVNRREATKDISLFDIIPCRLVIRNPRPEIYIFIYSIGETAYCTERLSIAWLMDCSYSIEYTLAHVTTYTFKDTMENFIEKILKK